MRAILVVSLCTACAAVPPRMESMRVHVQLRADSNEVALIRHDTAPEDLWAPGVQDPVVCKAPCDTRFVLRPLSSLYLGGDGVTRTDAMPIGPADKNLLIRAKAGSRGASVASGAGFMAFAIGVPLALLGGYATGWENYGCSAQSSSCGHGARNFTIGAAVGAGLGLLPWLSARPYAETTYTLERR